MVLPWPQFVTFFDDNDDDDDDDDDDDVQKHFLLAF